MDDLPIVLSRRTFLRRSAAGIGSLALASLLDPGLLSAPACAAEPAKTSAGARWPGAVHPLPYRQRVKRVIYLYMAGGPSHLETFDYKPALAKMDGQPMPESFTKGQQIAQLQGQKLRCFGPQSSFQRYGKSGLEMSELFPYLGKVADEICIVRSMYTEQINHDPAHTFMNSGTNLAGRPSMGSWVLYGLGSESEDLPGFVVLTSTGRGGQNQPIAARQWSAGFLPSRFQGILFHSSGDPVLYLSDPPGVTRADDRRLLDAVDALDDLRDKETHDPEIQTRVAQYEMAFRMQMSVPELMDLSHEPASTLDLYGAHPGDGSFAANCLLARRLAERGVRFIQLYHRDWDHHYNIRNDIKLKAEEVDRACYALLTDLKQRGLLEDTLVVFGGEFGRTPMAQGDGRDHHIKGFSMWLAGGPIKGGLAYGATDDLGYAAVQNPVSVHDLHATLLYLFGVEHTKFTYHYQGRDFRLTDVSGAPVKDILT
ncbi:MAG TPA: DUF1501 domain-containing protein [Chthonomonadaceae bacterium]|nr:DUF1501 domain-containing protein [Chthonomonadaceae bacterium]